MLDRSKTDLIQAILIEINQVNIDNRKGKNLEEDNIGLLCIMLNLVNNWKKETVSAKSLEDLCKGDKKMEAGFKYLEKIVELYI